MISIERSDHHKESAFSAHIPPPKQEHNQQQDDCDPQDPDFGIKLLLHGSRLIPLSVR